MNSTLSFRIILTIFLSTLFACGTEKTNIENGHLKSAQSNEEQEFFEEKFTVAFYNVENLFDIYDDPKTNDNQFLPSSEKNWNAERYSEKLRNLSKVLNALANDANDSPDLIGLVEIENEQVIKDLISQMKSIKATYGIVHENSPDTRGIDVGLIYNKEVFEYKSHENLRVYFEQNPDIKTRDILYVEGSVNQKDVHVFVNHWSSRRDGEKETEFKRLACARTVKKKIVEIQSKDPNANILLMGDYNDYPDNKSIVNVLRADNSGDALSFYNTALSVHEKGGGTYNYRGKWGMLDQIIISNEMKNSSVFKLSSDINIVKEEWMLYKNKKYGDMRPNRSYGGTNYYGGYSDHLPVYVQFILNF